MSIVPTKLIELLDPVAPPEGPEYHLASRPKSLARKVVALFDDNEANARELLDDLAELLITREGIAGIRYRNQNNGEACDIFGNKRVDVPQETLEKTASKVDAAIVGVGH